MMFFTVNEEQLFYALSDLMGKGLILNEMDKQKEKIEEEWTKKGRMHRSLVFEVLDYNFSRLIELSYKLDKAGYTPENALEGYNAIYPTLEPYKI